MKYKDFKALVLESLAERYCTFEGIKKFLEKKIGAEIRQDDLIEILDWQTIAREINKFSHTGFSAYLPAGVEPVAMFLAGGGRVNYLQPGDNDPLAKTGFPLTPVMPYTGERDILIDDEKDYVVTPFFTGQDLQRISDLIADNNSYDEVAAALGISDKLFTVRARSDGQTKSAIARGRERYAVNEKAKVIYALALEGKSTEEIEKALKVGDLSSVLLDSKELRTALQLGRDEYLAANPPPVIPKKAPEPEDETPIRKERVLSRKRLCVCGKPLGARVSECKDCYLLKRTPNAPVTAPKIDYSEVNHEIEQILTAPNLNRAELLKIALSVILECPISQVKHQFHQRLLDMVFADTPSESYPKLQAVK